MATKRSHDCKCSLHEQLLKDGDRPKIFNLESGKKVKVATRQLMVDKNVIGPKAKYVCEKCVFHFENENPTKKTKTEKENSAVNIIVEQLKCNELSTNDIQNIAFALGENICCHEHPPEVKYGEYLESFNVTSEIEKYDSKLVAFLKGLASRSACSENKILNLLENLHSVIDNSFVGPLGFFNNLLAYYITGSRAIVDLNNKISPCGSYNTVTSFLQNCTTDHDNLPDCDGVFFMDNNQILGKRWNIVYDCKASLSVVTTLLYLIPPVESNLQKQPQLSPFLWLTETSEKSFLYCEQYELYFRNYRNTFIQNILKEVFDDQSLENDNIIDTVDKINIGEMYTPSKVHHKVASMNPDGTLKFTPVHKDPYDEIESRVAGKASASLLDPLFVNPCSYAAVSTVFENIQEKTTGKQNWVAVGSDGLPYLLGSKLIENSFLCPVCKQSFKCRNVFLAHSDVHDENIHIDSCKKFGNILLIPGLGHYEINYTKGMFKLLWDVCLSELAKLMGFKSARALQNCQKACNHHKSWQLLNILLHGNARELMVPYVRHCIRNNIEPSVQGCFKYIESCGSNFVFMYKCTFTLLLALKLFRSGVRRFNYDAINCSMYKLSPLFYGLNMTSYMEIDIRRLILEEKCPADLKPVYQNLSCMSRSGHHSKAEGGDFILEAFNRKVKMFMPPGSATEKRWLKAYRNLPILEEMKQSVGVASIKADPEHEGFRAPNNDTETVQWRKKLRTSEYLSDLGCHKSLDGKPLDTELVKFDEKCKRNREKYSQVFPKYYKCERVFITPQDRSKYHDITTKTKAEIADEILKVFQRISEYDADEISNNLRLSWSAVKKGKKGDYLDFYKEVTQTLEELTALDENEDENLEMICDEEDCL